MNISYELAKELKDAGFPQKGVWGISHQAGTGVLLRHSTLTQLPEVYAPTLEELIEACGEEFSDVVKLFSFPEEKRWEAAQRNPNIKAFGATLIEAVARLWLALNKHD